MADFVLAISAVVTAYNTYLTANAAVVAAQAAITDAGAEPTPPTLVAADATWNDYVTANDTWMTNNATLQATLVTATVARRTAELGVITALGYGSGDTPSSIALNQWVAVTNTGGGVLTYSNWIGASSQSTYLTISTTSPTHAFPNI